MRKGDILPSSYQIGSTDRCVGLRAVKAPPPSRLEGINRSRRYWGLRVLIDLQAGVPQNPPMPELCCLDPLNLRL